MVYLDLHACHYITTKNIKNKAGGANGVGGDGAQNSGELGTPFQGFCFKIIHQK